MAVTLSEVARAAGVSVATASRTFKYPDRVSDRTRERVLQAATDLKYLANDQKLQQSDSLTLAVVTAEIRNPGFAQQLSAIDEQAWQGGHRILLAGSAQDPAREREAITALRPHCDGIVPISPRSTAEELQEFVQTTPAVVINGASSSSWPTVLTAADAGIAQAIEHLAALGHRHVAFAPGSPTSWANTNRIAAMQRHAEEHGIRLTIVANRAPTAQGGLSAAAAIAATGATAVVGYNDFVAMGLIAGLRSLGLYCPRDISVIGIDDDPMAAISYPPLTSITTGLRPCASRAFQLLRTMIAEGKSLSRVEIGESQLIVRGSTGAAPSRGTHDQAAAGVREAVTI